jgi:hypothetical protein
MNELGFFMIRITIEIFNYVKDDKFIQKSCICDVCHSERSEESLVNIFSTFQEEKT